MLLSEMSITIDPPDVLAVDVFESRRFRPDLYEKLEKRLFMPLGYCPGKLFVRHPVSRSEMAGLSGRVSVVKVEDSVLPPLSLSEAL
jgi:hypothetical protein